MSIKKEERRRKKKGEEEDEEEEEAPRRLKRPHPHPIPFQKCFRGRPTKAHLIIFKKKKKSITNLLTLI